MATRLTLNHGGRRRNRAPPSGGGSGRYYRRAGSGDGGGVTLPTDPDDLAAVTALLDSLAVKPLTLHSSYEGFISGQIVINCRDYPGKTRQRSGTGQR